MIIAGLQKMTLLDYPGKVACTVFLPGCNFRCPFCHNSGLLEGSQDSIPEEELLAFLKKRQGLLDGVCVTGGEPTLQKDLPRLLEAIRALGYAVKLDTNGSRPEVLEELLKRDLVQYVAMDVKNGPGQYPKTVGLEAIDLAPLEQSLRLLLEGGCAYELRTTCVRELHSIEAMEAMGAWLEGLVPGVKPRALYLQRFTDRDSVLVSGLHAPERVTMEKMAKALEPHVESVFLRGVE